MAVTFLRGKPILCLNNEWQVLKDKDSSEEILVAVDDIKRVSAAKVHQLDSSDKVALIIGAVWRSNLNLRTMTYYELTEPIETIASVLNREIDELNTLLLEAEIKED